MSELAGTRIGVYDVLAPLGEGGMGEVYRARDTKLGRDVAIKVLPQAFALDPERLARFEREAQALAALNHPNIAQIYGVIEETPALVMELVEGEDLAHRLARGSIPTAEALPIARQIAEALAAAHERGIIHRDLKPANVKLRPDGAVKVLDFGLAKAVDGPSGGGFARANVDAANSPTFTSPGVRPGSSAARTKAGAMLGTAAYMSPEQARGRPVDRRSDVWAFGCVLFEMLTGHRPFDGAAASDVIAAILRDPAPIAALPSDTPPPVRRLVRRCLEKDPGKRLDSMAAARLEIEDAERGDDQGPSDRRIIVASSRRMTALAWMTAALAVLLAAGWWWSASHHEAPRAHPLRLSIVSGVPEGIDARLEPAFDISKDGTTLVLSSHAPDNNGRLFVRKLDQLTASPLDGTEGATSPFLSPGGDWIGYFARGKLWKIAVGGGASIPLADVQTPRGAVWGADDVISFTPDANPGARIHRVAAAGGAVTPLGSMAAGHVTQRWPQALPGNRGILYTGGPTVDDFENACLVVQPLDGGAPRVVQCGGYFWRYLPGGYIVYVHNGTLFGARFDVGTLTLTSAAVPVLRDVLGTAVSGSAQFTVSDEGTLAYLRAGDASAFGEITVIDRQGSTDTLKGAPSDWQSLAYSPDGKRLAMHVSTQGQGGIWVVDIERGVSSRLTRDTITDILPIWSPDGTRLVYASGRGGAPNLFWTNADGTSGPRRLTLGPTVQTPGSWSPDGRTIAFMQQAQNGFDIWMLPVRTTPAGLEAGTPRAWLATDANEGLPAFSPDGKWISYASNESGTAQVYVRPISGRGRWQVSTDGGLWSAWSARSSSVLFATADGRIMTVTYSVEGGAFHASHPEPWGTAGYVARGAGAPFALNPDGNRIATSSAAPDLNPRHVELVTDFIEELRAKLPSRQVERK